MTGTITYILARAGWRAMNGPLADERRRLAGAEPPAAYVSYDPRLLAGAGWYGYRIALKGGDRQMVERTRYMLSERYIIRDGYEYFADGVYVFGVLLRERVPHYGVGGGAPTPEHDALNFYMPNGGTITLTKNGSPTEVTLEYWIEGEPNWVTWTETNNVRSLTLSAGGKVYIRNASTVSTGFSTSASNFYRFSFSDITNADGSVDSLLCKNHDDAILTEYCYYRLFGQCSFLKKPPLLLNNKSAKEFCYGAMFISSGIESPPEMSMRSASTGFCQSMFENCSYLTESPVLRFTVIQNSSSALKWMFNGCSNLKKITILSTVLSSSKCLYNWVGDVSATGDFYCPAELTIPTGTSGIPSGWTRHDI